MKITKKRPQIYIVLWVLLFKVISSSNYVPQIYIVLWVLLFKVISSSNFQLCTVRFSYVQSLSFYEKTAVYYNSTYMKIAVCITLVKFLNHLVSIGLLISVAHHMIWCTVDRSID
jgi:hypothetical protein